MILYVNQWTNSLRQQFITKRRPERIFWGASIIDWTHVYDAGGSDCVSAAILGLKIAPQALNLVELKRTVHVLVFTFTLFLIDHNHQNQGLYQAICSNAWYGVVNMLDKTIQQGGTVFKESGWEVLIYALRASARAIRMLFMPKFLELIVYKY